MANPCKQKRFVSHGGDVWGFARKYNLPLEKVLDFSGPINYLGPSPKALESVKQNAKLIKFYPDPNPVEFREEIAKYVGHNVRAENIVLGNGSIELIYMIAEVFKPVFNAVIPIPSFSEYEKAVLRVGGGVSFVQLPENFDLDNDALKKAITKETKIIYLCNPHSPSGKLFSRQTILDLAEFCRKKGIIVSVDENYIEFARKGQDETVAGCVTEYENLFVIRSVTKFYGMPGIRFGYAIAAENLAETLQIVRQPWSINSLAGCVTLAAFGDEEFISKTKSTIDQEKTRFVEMLRRINGLHVYPSETNFLLVKIKSAEISSTNLKEELAKDGLLIRDCCTFAGLNNTFFRVTVRSYEENKMLVEKTEKILTKA